MICIYNLQGGGAERVLLNLLALLDKNTFNITLLVLKKEGIYISKIPSHINVVYGFKTFLGRKLCNRFLKFLPPRILYKIFVKQKFDFEISFLEGYSTKVISGSTFDSKKIAWVHADFENYHWTNSIFSLKEEMNYYSKFNNIVCVSEKCLKSFKNIFGFEEKLKLIYNVLNKNLENYDKIHFKNVFNDFKTPKIICVGRLEKEKGVERLLKIFIEEIKNFNYEGSLIFLGEGSLKTPLKKLVEENCLSENVKFIGFKENVEDYILSSDYVIVPSYSESFCLVLSESICLGKICISTDNGGGTEILNNGECGLVVENSDEGIREAIVRVLCGERLKEIYEKNLDSWIVNFKSEVILEKIHELLT